MAMPDTGLEKFNISADPKSMTGESETISDASKYVKLNVGECLFRTTMGTLTKYDTMLRAMFSGDMAVVTDSDGFVVIDRCGKHFGVILNYLRDGDVALPHSKRELRELLAEAEYYRIEELIAHIKPLEDKQKVAKDKSVNPCFVFKSSQEAKAIIESSSKPVITCAMPCLNLNHRCKSTEDNMANYIRNIELFDRLFVQYQKSMCFIKIVSNSDCLWTFKGKTTSCVRCGYSSNIQYQECEVIKAMLDLVLPYATLGDDTDDNDEEETDA